MSIPIKQKRNELPLVIQEQVAVQKEWEPEQACSWALDGQWQRLRGS